MNKIVDQLRIYRKYRDSRNAYVATEHVFPYEIGDLKSQYDARHAANVKEIELNAQLDGYHYIFVKEQNQPAAE